MGDAAVSAVFRTQVFRSRRAVLPDGERPADIVVRDGVIAAVEPYGTVGGAPEGAAGATPGRAPGGNPGGAPSSDPGREPSGRPDGAPGGGAGGNPGGGPASELGAGYEVHDLGDLALLPGLVDTHVHINEPGRTEWEGFATATRAAAAGGVTTLIDMPLNSIPPTTTVEHLRMKRECAAGVVHVDVGFWGGAVPGNVGDFAGLVDEGVFGFKAFLAPSGVDEFPELSDRDLVAALTELARLDALAIVHAESPTVLDAAPHRAGRDYRDFLASRPDAAETHAVADLLAAATATGARVHVLHVSSSEVLWQLAEARRRGIAVTAETCPHYLCLAAEQVPEGDTSFKCCPPIRDERNRERLWAGLAGGAFAAVVSDHSPCTADLKRLDEGDFAAAWGGIASVQLGLPAVWTEARARCHSLADVVEWMSAGPARLAGLSRKGAIAAGHDADLVAFDPDGLFTVNPARLHHRNPVTPYAGRTLAGVVHETWLRGEPVAADGPPRGRLLRHVDHETG